MQMNTRRYLSFVENDTIFCSLCWKVVLERSTKSELVFWFQSKDYVADALDEDMLYCNSDKELGDERDSDVIHWNVFKNPLIYNIKYTELTKNQKQRKWHTII